MNIIPAIDIYDGKVVRLRQGDFNEKTQYELDAKKLVQDYEAAGFNRVHIVDLSGAETGQMRQQQLIAALCANATIQMQVGGGIRSQEQIKQLLEAGVERVVIGSLAVEHSSVVADWLNIFGAERIVIAIDVSIQDEMPMVMTQGWQRRSSVNLSDLLTRFPVGAIKHVLCTDIQRDGLLQGPNVQLYQKLLLQFPTIAWIASGGVANVVDLNALTAIGIEDVVVGKALYEQRISIAECLEVQRC